MPEHAHRARRTLRTLRIAAGLAAGAMLLQNSGCSVDTQALVAEILAAVFDTLLTVIEASATA